MSYPNLISTPEIPTMSIQHEDGRRIIREVEITQPNGLLRRVTSIIVKDSQDGTPAVLGNHYHDKTEDFIVVAGNPTVYTQDVVGLDAPRVHNFPEGGHISMEPGLGHTFVFDGAGVLFSTMEGTFEEAGMYPHKLV